MMQVNPLGAHVGAPRAAGARAMQAGLGGHRRTERAVQPRHEAQQGAQGAEAVAPFSQEHDLRHEDDGEHHERQRRLAELEQAPKGDEGGHGKAHGADEAEHREPERSRREDGPAQHPVARIVQTPALGRRDIERPGIP